MIEEMMQSFLAAIRAASRPVCVEDARARKLAAERLLRELDLVDTYRHEPVPAGLFAKEFEAVCERLIARQLALPGRLAPLLAAARKDV